MITLSIIIPCYNEAGTLPHLFEACRRALLIDINTEVIFVNNGSTDNSGAVFAKLLDKPEYRFARMVHVPVNKGYGYGILQGLKNAKGKVLAWTHADMQTDPADVFSAFKMYQKELLDNTIIVKGKRRGRKVVDEVFTALMSVVASALLGVKLSDINAQPKIFHRDVLVKLVNAPWDFSLDVYLLYFAKRENLMIKEYPVIFSNRRSGQAKGGGTFKGKINLVKRTFKFIFELRKNIKK